MTTTTTTTTFASFSSVVPTPSYLELKRESCALINFFFHFEYLDFFSANFEFGVGGEICFRRMFEFQTTLKSGKALLGQND